MVYTPRCEEALSIIRIELGINYGEWFPSAIVYILPEDLLEDARREMYYADCLNLEYNVKHQQQVCKIATDKFFPNRTEMLLLAISLAKDESELNTTDDQHHGRTLLQSLMLTDSHAEIIRLMVVCGASTAKWDKDGQNAFHWAAKLGRYDYVFAMSAKIKSLERLKPKDTFDFFHYIPEKDPSRLAGVSCMGAWNRYGETPLHLVPRFVEDTARASMLIRALVSHHDVSIDSEDDTHEQGVMMLLCRSGRVELAMLCVELGADVYKKGKDGFCPMDVIRADGRLESLKDILD